jgi:hypothetical protein
MADTPSHTIGKALKRPASKSPSGVRPHVAKVIYACRACGKTTSKIERNQDRCKKCLSQNAPVTVPVAAVKSPQDRKSVQAVLKRKVRGRRPSQSGAR